MMFLLKSQSSVWKHHVCRRALWGNNNRQFVPSTRSGLRGCRQTGNEWPWPQPSACRGGPTDERCQWSTHTGMQSTVIRKLHHVWMQFRLLCEAKHTNMVCWMNTILIVTRLTSAHTSLSGVHLFRYFLYPRVFETSTLFPLDCPHWVLRFKLAPVPKACPWRVVVNHYCPVACLAHLLRILNVLYFVFALYCICKF